MSASEILVPDSDSESDVTGRKQRIQQLKQRYLDGQNLFIMSSAIKGQLKQSPWARKRKRPNSPSSIASYYPSKKIVQASVERKPMSKITNDESASIDLAPPAAKSPIWDQTIESRLQDPLPRPTARLIDFRQYDSQKPSQLLLKAQSSKTKNAQVQTEDVIVSDITSPSSIEGENGQKEENRSRSKSRQGTPRQLELAVLQEARQPLVGEQTSSSPVHERSLIQDNPMEDDKRRRNDGKSPALPVPDDDEEVIRNSSTIQQVDPPTLIYQAETSERDSISNEPHLTPRHGTQGDLSDTFINTQAELASAQRGLASALQFTDEVDTVSLRDESESKSDRQSLVPGNGDISLMMDPDLSIFAGEVPHESSLPSSPHRDPVYAERNDVSLASQVDRIPVTPHKTTSDDLPLFAQFQSPLATPSGSVLSFGSPITFSPDRRHGNTSPSKRRSGNLDDLHKYLQNSVFDIDREARELLFEDVPA